MNTCDTCRHWKTREEVIGPPDRATVASRKRDLPESGMRLLEEERKEHVCTQGWFSISDVDESYYNTGISTDYSTDMLITKKDFGCIHHESIQLTEK